MTYYQKGMDHWNTDDLRRVREWLKIEFNSSAMVVNGQVNQVAGPTKGGPARHAFLERVVAWLLENYALPPEALDPGAYAVWRDTVFPDGGPKCYIYMLSI